MGAHINKYYTYQIDAADIYTRTEGGETHPATTSIFTCDHTSISKLISIHTDTEGRNERTPTTSEHASGTHGTGRRTVALQGKVSAISIYHH